MNFLAQPFGFRRALLAAVVLASAGKLLYTALLEGQPAASGPVPTPQLSTRLPTDLNELPATFAGSTASAPLPSPALDQDLTPLPSVPPPLVLKHTPHLSDPHGHQAHQPHPTPGH